MSLLSNIVGFSLFGLAARFGQLGIQKRNLFDNPGAHLIAMGVFGYGGYWAYQWDQRAAVLIAEKRAEIQERRKQQVTAAEEAGAAALAHAH
ncbi:hypothetical protein PC9H_009466 [Pleurotus ostreatus]|uniref:Uncharacterized protein n=2 Tax=Pleurotus ostreatus TaxID=5322 RepID=A0A067NBV1_PLEO1|nr:uncharacterized protein PC9H_009466 [Pleurotus ostreatus]KAF7424163.1 hypothetical protein PC9H_009466 [Pleurotus ostreatus]KAJ8692985.1 hypothetical protein PTI98_010243 [Pleurotus ostreatus]KDQ24415.1 hypothetical protein PLEOSDRAFT_1046963 [Pleurotus ostreatus PC15]